MKTFEIRVLIKGHANEEDPQCPAGWIGSGVYDIEVNVSQEATCYVNANSKEDALSLVDEYGFSGEIEWQIEDVEIKSVEVIDTDNKEALGVSDVILGKEYYPYNDGPDPDEAYEARRDREDVPV